VTKCDCLSKWRPPDALHEIKKKKNSSTILVVGEKKECPYLFLRKITVKIIQ